MTRKLGVQYPGALCHAMNQGDQREDIVEKDNDRRLFLETIGQGCANADGPGRKVVVCENTLF